MVLIGLEEVREQGNHCLTSIKLQFVRQKEFQRLDKNYTVNILNELYVQLVTVKMVNFRFVYLTQLETLKIYSLFQTHTNTHNFIFSYLRVLSVGSPARVSVETNQGVSRRCISAGERSFQKEFRPLVFGCLPPS